MNFTISTIAKSLADYLATSLPGVSFYEDPNQQGTVLPCAFLQQRYSYLERQTGGYWLRRIGLDLTYLVDYNLPNMQQLYQAAAETLDLTLDAFPYSDGENAPVLIQAHNREWNIDLDALHYKFEIRERVSLPEDGTPMRVIEDYKETVTA